MDEQKYISDLKDIRDIMQRSSRFISLSGLSGVCAGIFALIGVYAAYLTVYTDQSYLGYERVVITYKDILALVIIALITVTLSVITGIYFTSKEARKNNEQLWDHQTKRLLINLAIPLVSGGLFCLILLFKGYVGLVAPATLIFYGLALVNASKYTLGDIRSLGIIEIMLGLIATYLIGYGLLFWAFGFGIMHIVYGILMQVKNKS